MGNEQKKAHVGFPEKVLEKYAKILVDNGHQLVVVEQTEVTLKNKIAKSGKTVGREVSEVLTKSTFCAYHAIDNFEPSLLLSVVEIQDFFGIALADLSTSDIIIGEITQDEFRNLLARSRPVEFIYSNHFISLTSLKLIKSLPVPPNLSVIKDSEV